MQRRRMTRQEGRIRNGGVARPRRALAGLVVALWALPGPGRADFIVCNDSFDVLNVAVAHDPGDGFASEGWWTITPNRCVDVIRSRIRSRYVYVFATDVFNQPVLEGLAAFCIDEGRFRIAGREACWSRGHLAADFAEIDIGETRDFILFLNTSGTLPAR